jgi:putative glycosyltransferase
MKLSVVSTLYYSASYIHEFYARIISTINKIGVDYEIVFVNDGSPDNSLNVCLELQKQDNKIVIVDLSRNFGHHKAIMTGLKIATGDRIFLIDIDLEEDPELLETFWSEMDPNPTLDVVFGIQQKRKGGFFERVSGNLFYKTFSMLSDIDYPHDTLTARLMSKKYVEGVLQYGEKSLEIWGIFVLTGFNQKGITVTKGYKGTSTYTLSRKLKMAMESITSFSNKPLYLIFFIGLILTIFAFINIAIVFYEKIFLNVDVEGWASIVATIWLVGGITMFMLGIIGIYLSKIFVEIKNRPLTIIRDIYKK